MVTPMNNINKAIQTTMTDSYYTKGRAWYLIIPEDGTAWPHLMTRKRDATEIYVARPTTQNNMIHAIVFMKEEKNKSGGGMT